MCGGGLVVGEGTEVSIVQLEDGGLFTADLHVPIEGDEALLPGLARLCLGLEEGEEGFEVIEEEGVSVHLNAKHCGEGVVSAALPLVFVVLLVLQVMWIPSPSSSCQLCDEGLNPQCPVPVARLIPVFADDGLGLGRGHSIVGGDNEALLRVDGIRKVVEGDIARPVIATIAGYRILPGVRANSSGYKARHLIGEGVRVCVDEVLRRRNEGPKGSSEGVEVRGHIQPQGRH